MNTKQWYEALFEDYCQKYDNECFTRGALSHEDKLTTEDFEMLVIAER